MMKIYDLLWKRQEKDGKVKWEKVGVLVEKEDGKRSIKFDLLPISNWDGWLVVAEKKEKELF